MATFKMRNRPKKPVEPRAISEEIGDCTLFTELKEKVDKFVEKHQISIDKVEVVVGDSWKDDYYSTICLESPGKTHSLYNREILVYQAELKEYNKWRQDNRVEIEKEKLRLKAEIKQRKLEMSVGKAKKNLEEAERKLCNSK